MGIPFSMGSTKRKEEEDAANRDTELWLYCRNIALPTSSSAPGVEGISADLPTFTKHWAVVTKGPDNSLFYFHANNTNGLLLATHGPLDEEMLREEWEGEQIKKKKIKRFKKELLGKISFDIAQGEAFCDELNRRNEQYTIYMNNCQTFVANFVKKFGGGITLPMSGSKFGFGFGSAVIGSAIARNAFQ